MAKKTMNSVRWHIPLKSNPKRMSKKPFATSTKCEKDAINDLYVKYGDLRKIPRIRVSDINIPSKHGYQLNDNENFIIDTLIENGIYYL